MPVLVHYSSSFKACQVATRHLRPPWSARWAARPVASSERNVRSQMSLNRIDTPRVSGSSCTVQAAEKQTRYLSRQRQPTRFSKFQANKLASDRETANTVVLYSL